mgnify:CR=1 FL=1|tara:strand:+ start:12614 stop:13054 length:441 start_codon:yes stop_codon:yes gene_type:complete
MIKLQKQKINISKENKKILKKKIGAFVNFIGIARPTNNSKKIKFIEIEHYPGMTEKKIKKIEIYALKKWNLNSCIIIHRYGKIKPGENIVYIGTAAQHRINAFKACEFIIDYLKVKAPFWKTEHLNNKKIFVKSKKRDEKKIKLNY